MLLDDLIADVGFPLLQATVGEEVTYYPAIGPRRVITALILHEVELRPAQLQAGDDRELVKVTVAKDEPSGAIQGIVEPRRGDKLNRTEHGDRRGKLYAWTGVVLESDGATWTLEFERLRT